MVTVEFDNSLNGGLNPENETPLAFLDLSTSSSGISGGVDINFRPFTVLHNCQTFRVPNRTSGRSLSAIVAVPAMIVRLAFLLIF